jgi:hypothetical protein
MSPQEEENLFQITTEFTTLMADKYRKGNAEHNADLEDLIPTVILEEAIGEVVDLAVYLLTLKRKLHDFKTRNLRVTMDVLPAQGPITDGPKA